MAFTPFYKSLPGDFVFDDSEAIINNKDVTSNVWSNTFYNDFWGTNIKSNFSHKSYRPLTTLSFRLNFIVNGEKLDAHLFKGINLICHSLCSVVLIFVYEVIVKRVQKCNSRMYLDLSFVAAALFAVHPIHAEAVAGVVGRADILATMTFLISFLLYDQSMNNKKRTYIYLFTSVLLAGISMLFKENGITVLGFCIVYDIVLNCGKLKRNRINKFIATLIRITIVSLAGGLLIYARWKIMGGMKPEFKPGDNPAAFANDTFTKVATFHYIYFLNFLILLWPQWLCYDWSMGCIKLIESNKDFRIIFLILLYLYGILLLKTILLPNKKQSSKRLIFLAISLLTIPFLPASNILFPVGFVIAERILYLPSAGYCLLIAIGFHKIVNKYKKLKVSGVLLLLLLYQLKTWERAFDWQNEYNLFISGLKVCPLNAKVRYNVAKVVDARQNTSWAVSEYKEAIRLYPEYYQAMNNLANLLKNEKNFSGAEFYFKKAISVKHDFPAAWMNLGIVLANQKRYKESLEAYKTALQYRQHYSDCFYNMGNLYLELNDTDAARHSWSTAISYNPKHTFAWTNLIAMLDNMGQTERALQVIPEALYQLPKTPSLLFAVANLYGKTNQFTEAENLFKSAIKLFGEEVKAIHYANLGVLYHRWKKYDLAKKMYNQALQIDPTYMSAKKNLALLQN
ncbi:Transmembrane and TPR repeat-containing protein 4 [Papilio xuthus]|uniref:dolichyl-phosphate-mannose--protein mannosyltransferase n=1 Tax=Papilio xuthus TaxID=66420 RepID=A0A194PQG0_PAPXU|nr:Transmembrane and TPR repeat-containing protein 4 [Papilio xuthus]